MAAAERDRRLAELNSNVAELQAALSKRDHELEEAQRLYASQKKVLKVSFRRRDASHVPYDWSLWQCANRIHLNATGAPFS